PEEAQEITLPPGSVIETIVLLKVLLMCAWPCAMFLRSFRRTFLTPVRLFGGILLPLAPEVVGPTARARAAIRGCAATRQWTTSCRPSSCRPLSSSCPYECGRWSACADHAPEGRGDAGCPGSSQSRSCGGCRPAPRGAGHLR